MDDNHPSPTEAPSQLAAAALASKITRGHSCVLCQQRKVKCDRQKPCSNCVKARVECVASTPTLPRRRRRKITELDVMSRLRRYEQIMRRHGINFEDDGPDSQPASSYQAQDALEHLARLSMSVPRAENAERGALFGDQDKTRYVENTLWENLKDEIEDAQDSESSEDAIDANGIYPNAERLLLADGCIRQDLVSYHPPPVHIFRLWQTFLVNVNPLLKMFHAPTVQQIILDASDDLESLSRPTEALMFGIYFLAVTSLKSTECESMFGETRTSLIARYSQGLQLALMNAKFLKSLNLATLQAFTMFLLGTRKIYDPRTLWILTGANVRNAQRLGLHRDAGFSKISPFDAEMRRRTWWQVVFLDGQASKLAGAGFPAWLAKFDTKLPLNISDSDLSPTMHEPPTEKDGPTEMMFCCLRFEVAQALQNSGIFTQTKGESHTLTGPELIAKKDAAINELEARFEKKFIRHCDPSIPLHLLVIHVAHAVICTMKIMSHHPRQYLGKDFVMPQSEKDFLFGESLKVLEYESLGYTTKNIEGFLWHMHAHFQLDAFIYLVSELRHRTSGSLVDRAWQQIQLTYEHRPELISQTKNSLYVAVGNLTVKAWQKHEEATGIRVPSPQFISLLRAQRGIADLPTSVTKIPHQTLYLNEPSNPACPTPVDGFSTSSQYQYPVQSWGNMDLSMSYEALLPMPEITPIDWQYWQTLMGSDLPPYSGDMGQGYGPRP